MLEFLLYKGRGRLKVDPASIESVAEMDVHGRQGNVLIAEISLKSGVQYLVLDAHREVIDKIGEAKGQIGSTQERVAKALESLGAA